MSQAHGSVLEPLSTNPLTRLGIFGIGGLVNKGVPFVYRTLGGRIDFEASKLSGIVDIFRSAAYNEGGAAQCYVVFEKARKAIVTKVRKVFKDITPKTKGDIRVLNINSLYDLESLILLDTFTELIDDLYNQPCWKNAGDRSYEKFFYVGFCSDQPIRGITTEGIHYRIFPPEYSIATQTRVAVNKCVWQLIKRFQGYTKVAAILDYMFLDHLFKNSTRYSTDTVLQVLSHLDQCPGINTIPDVIRFITDEIIRINLFKQVSNSLKNEEWMTPCTYDVIKPQHSDKALETTISHATQTWGLNQVKKTTNGPFNLRILPFSDGMIYSKELKYPCLQIGRLHTKNIGTNRDISLVNLQMLNGGVDGNKPVTTYIFDRHYGHWHGSLELESSAMELAHVIPSFFGVERPTDINTSVERRHWKVVFKTKDQWKYLIHDFSKMTTTEQYMYGIHSFTGPNTYLVNSNAFITNKKIAAVNENSRPQPIINLFS